MPERENTILYATDVHGDLDFYRKLLETAAKKKVKAVVIGGDILPTSLLVFDASEQRLYLEYEMLPLFAGFRKKHKGIDIYIMMGNDDFIVNMDVLKAAEKKGVLKVMHNRVHKVGSLHMIGYSCVNPGPYPIKDWVKSEAEIRKDLQRLKGKLNGDDVILVTHVPPHKTRLDFYYGMRHVGSRSIREFIEKVQPRMSLHGHIHESFELTGTFTQKIGKTVAVNPGNARMVLINLDDPNSIKCLP
ncbi:MAG: metallophosphoesterase [Candidatus Aenigmarchaeota archaeon]|nr:metallophosphoesterase [Candidatus Aenigmarchaeota archaeon]